MKRAVSLILLSAMILASCLFASCGKDAGFEEYTYRNGMIVSEDGEKEYVPAPMGFQPVGVGEKCAVRDGAFDLYALVDKDGVALPTEEWMTEEYSGNASSVYYRKGISLPDFAEIDYEVCYLCDEDVSVVSVATIDDAELIGDLISRIADGVNSPGRIDDPKDSYTLKFHSSEFPALYFSVDYLIWDDASFLYSIGTKKYAEVTGLLDGFLGTDAE